MHDHSRSRLETPLILPHGYILSQFVRAMCLTGAYQSERKRLGKIAHRDIELFTQLTWTKRNCWVAQASPSKLRGLRRSKRTSRLAIRRLLFTQDARDVKDGPASPYGFCIAAV